MISETFEMDGMSEAMQWSDLGLDRGSSVPLYYQLAERIRARIRTGELQSGEQLPSERDLSEYAAVSRMTARHAIAHLVMEGTLVAHHGRGTFVAAPKLTYDAVGLLGFTEETTRHGGIVVSRVLEQVAVLPPQPIADDLGLPPDVYATRLVRLRSSGDMPLLLETSYVPIAFAPDLSRQDLSHQSLYVLLQQRYQLRLSHARQTVTATVANDYECVLFGIAAGTPMLVLEGTTFLDTNAPVECFKAVYRADRMQLSVESQRVGIPRVGVVLR